MKKITNKRIIPLKIKGIFLMIDTFRPKIKEII